MDTSEQIQLERLLQPGHLDDLHTWPTDRVREQLRASEAEEQIVSYARRMLHGYVDLLAAELRRRETAGGPESSDRVGALSDLVARLPQTTTAMQDVRPFPIRVPEGADGHVVPIQAAIARAGDLARADVDVLADLVAELSEHEQRIARLRRALFDRIDALHAELTARYRDGLAHVGDLLGDDPS